MAEYDVRTEILSLYKALRATTDELLQESLKERIELLIEQAHRSYRPDRIGTTH